MSEFWLKVKIWTKTTIFAVVVLYGLLFLYNNSTETVKFWWWFGHKDEHTSLAFGFSAFVGGVVFAILVRTLWTTVRQVQTLKAINRQQKMERDVAEMKEKAAKLQTRGPIVAAPATTGAFEVNTPKAE